MKHTILLLVLLTLCYKLSIAQRPTEIDPTTIESQRQRTDKGMSCVFFDWNINQNEVFENLQYGGISKNFDIGVGHFFADRYCATIKSGLYAFANSTGNYPNTFLRDYRAELSVRRYFFKRAAAYLELGVRGGAYKKIKASTENVSLNYVAPLVSVGYEYLITDLHPVLNNHLGVKIGMTSLIPIKKELYETHLPVFPGVELKFGVMYYFSRW